MTIVRLFLRSLSLSLTIPKIEAVHQHFNKKATYGPRAMLCYELVEVREVDVVD